MFGFFSKKVEKQEFQQLKEAVQTDFNSVKQDMGNVSHWIKHLETSNSKLNEEVQELREILSTINDEVENIKNVVAVVGNREMFKRPSTVFNKQTVFKGVLNSVQTSVQTVFLDNLSATERAIVLVLLNSDIKLSYEDLAAMLGKRKATIRGQINSIKQKSEGLVEEVIGENNKKRIFIPEKAKEILLKTRKVRVNTKKEPVRY